MSVCTKPTRLVGFLQSQLTEIKVCRQTCCSNRTHYPDFEPISLFLLLLNAKCLEEKQQIPILIVFGLTQPGLEPTIYCTRGNHANHYQQNSNKNVPLLEFTHKCKVGQSPMFINIHILTYQSYTYRSWIYNYLCNQCLSPLTL